MVRSHRSKEVTQTSFHPTVINWSMIFRTTVGTSLLQRFRADCESEWNVYIASAGLNQKVGPRYVIQPSHFLTNKNSLGMITECTPALARFDFKISRRSSSTSNDWIEIWIWWVDYFHHCSFKLSVRWEFYFDHSDSRLCLMSIKMKYNFCKFIKISI